MSNKSNLKDQADRDAAISNHSESIFIDAGAGTGKTETIVQRIVQQILAKEDFDMNSLAAITFTEKAGAELRNRFRRVFLEAKRDAPEAQHSRIDNIVNSIDSAAIGTIHSFCKRILTDHSITAKLPVGFQIQSESAGPRLRIQRARRIADMAFDSLSEKEKEILTELEFEAKAMQEIVTSLDERFATVYELDLSQSRAAESEDESAVYSFIHKSIDFLKADMERRRGLGEIEFDDLLLLTRHLLKTDSVLRDVISAQYRVLLVDEFQDTDPVQWQIVRLITQQNSQDAAPRPGSLVLVGDPKQSIYRFRNADIDTFLKVKESFTSSSGGNQGEFGSVRDLTSNFRSVKPVIEFVNWLFQDTEQKNPLHMGVGYKELISVHNPEANDAGDAVRVLVNPQKADGSGVEKIDTLAECRWVANEIKRVVVEGYRVTEKVSKHARDYRAEKANFGDICILVPVRTQIGELVRALSTVKVPFVSADPSIVFTRPLAIGLVNALKVVAQLDDDLALFAALKSPLFGLTDEQLVVYKQSPGSSWNIDGYARGGEPNVQKAMELLYDVRTSAGVQRPSVVFNSLLTELQIFEKLAAEPDGDFEATALRMLISHATQWENDGNTGLLQYADSLEILIDSKNKTLLPIPNNLNQNAVQIMTIHASKGLEFPVTVLACMSNTPNNNPPRILISKEGQIEFNLGKNSEDENVRSSGFDELYSGDEATAEEQELNRLLYVAMTRAKDHLIVSALMRASNSRSAVIQAAMDQLGEAPSGLFTKVSTYEEVMAALPERLPVLDPDLKLRTDFDSQIAASQVRHVVSPSSKGATNMKVLQRAQVEELDFAAELEIEDNVAEDFETASQLDAVNIDRRPFGKALHGTMELVIRHGQIPDEETLQTYLWNQAELHGALDELASLSRRVSHLLKNSTVLEALSTEERWPELHLAIADPDDEIRLAEGFADLVYKNDKGYVLVDYKTDKEIGASQIMHYQQQLGAYAIILEKLTGSLPVRIVLLHAQETGVEEIELYLD